MRKIFSEENVYVSIQNLLTKKESCGIDGIFISQYEEYWKLNKENILNNIYRGSYEPEPVQSVEILKRNGKKRIISKYTCTDRVILDVIKREITPLWKNTFSEFSFAYQENKGLQDAVRQAARYIEAGNEWVVEIDIEKFFDNIGLEQLLEKLEHRIQKKELLELIRKYFYIMVQTDTGRKRKYVGIVQGSPLSPLCSNVYMDEFDHYMEQKYQFCRFSDNINIYCKKYSEAEHIMEEVQGYLGENLALKCNKEKSGIYSSLTRRYLGYEFNKTKNGRRIQIRRHDYHQDNFYSKWHTSAIQKIDRNYHLINEGILTKQDYTILFENEEKKCYLPVETCDSINIYAQVTFGSSFFEYAKRKKLQINIYDKYGEYVGSFCTATHYKAAKTMLKQAELYNNPENRLGIAKNIELASLHNQRENLRYFYKRKKHGQLGRCIDEMTDLMAELKHCESMDTLLLTEARAKQKYLKMFDIMIDDKNFLFEKRTRRPPLNERIRNYSVGLCIYCTDRKKMIQECKNPIAESDFKWIFACNCEGTEQLRECFD